MFLCVFPLEVGIVLCIFVALYHPEMKGGASCDCFLSNLSFRGESHPYAIVPLGMDPMGFPPLIGIMFAHLY